MLSHTHTHTHKKRDASNNELQEEFGATTTIMPEGNWKSTLHDNVQAELLNVLLIKRGVCICCCVHVFSFFLSFFLVCIGLSFGGLDQHSIDLTESADDFPSKQWDMNDLPQVKIVGEEILSLYENENSNNDLLEPIPHPQEHLAASESLFPEDFKLPQGNSPTKPSAAQEYKPIHNIYFDPPEWYSTRFHATDLTYSFSPQSECMLHYNQILTLLSTQGQLCICLCSCTKAEDKENGNKENEKQKQKEKEKETKKEKENESENGNYQKELQKESGNNSNDNKDNNKDGDNGNDKDNDNMNVSENENENKNKNDNENDNTIKNNNNNNDNNDNDDDDDNEKEIGIEEREKNEKLEHTNINGHDQQQLMDVAELEANEEKELIANTNFETPKRRPLPLNDETIVQTVIKQTIAKQQQRAEECAKLKEQLLAESSQNNMCVSSLTS
ncbi:hypothetical protein RFI_11060, partial [Reticulomyxa filosa]